MDGAERWLAWFTETLARHQPDEALSFTEAQARFIAVLTGLIAVERGGGMVFGLILSGEHADALMRAALPALTEAVQAWRAHFERRYGERGRQEIARIAAELRYAPLLDRGALRPDAEVDAALERFIDACLDPLHAAPPAWSVAVKLPSPDRRREVAEAEALRGAFHPQIEALYASIDGLVLLPSASAPSRLPWPAVFPSRAILLVSPLAWASVVRKSSSWRGQTEQLVPLARLPAHMLPRGKESERGVEYEYEVSLYLAFRVGTAEIYLTDDSYSAPPCLLAADLVSFLGVLRGAAPHVDSMLAALASGFGGGAASAG